PALVGPLGVCIRLGRNKGPKARQRVPPVDLGIPASGVGKIPALVGPLRAEDEHISHGNYQALSVVSVPPTRTRIALVAPWCNRNWVVLWQRYDRLLLLRLHGMHEQCIRCKLLYCH